MNHQNYEQSNMYKIRHSAAHVLAQAVRVFYPDAKLGIGPPIDHGFYYDFDLGVDAEGQRLSFSPDDLPKLEAEMRRIIKGKHPFEYREVSYDEARQLFANDPYKLVLIDGLEENGRLPSIYQQDDFIDLCKGPHVEHTGQIPVNGLKLMNIAGAYWQGDENQPMLQRIYGTAWHNKKELKQHLHQLEEAKKRDHRKLGKALEIFILDEEVGPGLPIWLPNGFILREELEKLAWEVEEKAGYQRVSTPHIAKEDLFYRSGHLPYYKEDMYPPMEDESGNYYLKPMNCPFHHKVYSNKPRSYRDLPLRLTEYGMVYRYEQSGSLFGLLRVRGAEQNDAHIYCSEDQLESEFMAVIEMYKHYFELFGVEKYQMRLSKHSKAGLGKKYVDNEPLWIKMEQVIRQIMLNNDVPFVEEEDEAAFYGPKIDVQIWSAIGREFSLATNQIDFAVPERFDLQFINAKGERETPLCIHRAPLGSHERFIGFLIEHYAGAFPVWLAPEQVHVIPITDDHHAYADEVAKQLKVAGIRAFAKLGEDRMNSKIRQAQQMKVPYMLVVGDQEVENQSISVRQRDGVKHSGVELSEFKAKVQKLISERSKVL